MRSRRSTKGCMPHIRDTLPPMRVVFLTSRLPFPPEGGDRFRVFHQIRTASEAGHDVHLVTFARERPDPLSIAPLERLLASITVVPLLCSRVPRREGDRWARAVPGRVLPVAPHGGAGSPHSCASVRCGRDAPLPHGSIRLPTETVDARWILDLTDVISAGIARSLPFRKGPDRWLRESDVASSGTVEISPQFDECWVISDAERSDRAYRAGCRHTRGAERTRARVMPRRERARSGAAPLPGIPPGLHNRDAVRFLVQDILPRVRAGARRHARCPRRGRGRSARGPGPRRERARSRSASRALLRARPCSWRRTRFAAGVQNRWFTRSRTAFRWSRRRSCGRDSSPFPGTCS